MQFYMLLVDNQEKLLCFSLFEDLMQNNDKKNPSVILVPLSPFIYFTISINRSSALNLSSNKVYIRVVCNVNV